VELCCELLVDPVSSLPKTLADQLVLYPDQWWTGYKTNLYMS